MFRYFLEIIWFLVVLAALRKAISLLWKGFSSASTQDRVPFIRRPQPPPVTSGGELRRDPVCGTFIPVPSIFKKTVNGSVIHFCSASCRDSYKLA